MNLPFGWSTRQCFSYKCSYSVLLLRIAPLPSNPILSPRLYRSLQSTYSRCPQTALPGATSRAPVLPQHHRCAPCGTALGVLLGGKRRQTEFQSPLTNSPSYKQEASQLQASSPTPLSLSLLVYNKVEIMRVSISQGECED